MAGGRELGPMVGEGWQAPFAYGAQSPSFFLGVTRAPDGEAALLCNPRVTTKNPGLQGRKLQAHLGWEGALLSGMRLAGSAILNVAGCHARAKGL